MAPVNSIPGISGRWCEALSQSHKNVQVSGYWPKGAVSLWGLWNFPAPRVTSIRLIVFSPPPFLLLRGASPSLALELGWQVLGYFVSYCCPRCLDLLSFQTLLSWLPVFSQGCLPQNASKHLLCWFFFVEEEASGGRLYSAILDFLFLYSEKISWVVLLT